MGFFSSIGKKIGSEVHSLGQKAKSVVKKGVKVVSSHAGQIADVAGSVKDIAGGVNYVDIRNHHATGGAALRVKTQGSYGSPFYQGILGASDAGGTIRVGAVSNHPLVFIINNQEKVRINSSGNLHIGSGDPTIAKLQVSGAGFFGSANTTKTNDGVIIERNSSDGVAHITAGRSGGNYSGMNFYVAGASLSLIHI